MVEEQDRETTFSPKNSSKEHLNTANCLKGRCCEHTVRRHLATTQRRALTRNQLCRHLDFELLASRPVGSKFLLFKLPSLWSFVMTAGADQAFLHPFSPLKYTCNFIESTPITFSSGSVGKESTCSAGITGYAGSIPGSGTSPGGGHGNPLQYSCLENSHEQRSLAGYSSWDRKELDTPEVTEHACRHLDKPG